MPGLLGMAPKARRHWGSGTSTSYGYLVDEYLTFRINSVTSILLHIRVESISYSFSQALTIPMMMATKPVFHLRTAFLSRSMIELGGSLQVPILLFVVCCGWPGAGELRLLVA